MSSKDIILFVLFVFLLPNTILSQNFTLSGYVYDASTGEKLLGANIYDQITRKGTTSNDYGFYSLTLQKNDLLHIIVSYTGYTSIKLNIFFDSDIKKDFALQAGTLLDEVEIIALNEVPIEQRTEMSVITMPVKEIKALPALGGESDIIKAFQLMPGVQSGNEGTSGLYVRGGSPDQNLILLDDVPLYYVNHLGGFISIFNTDAINTVSLTKGGFPARYGSRLSSVLDVRMKEGNTKELHGGVMLGMVAAKANIEGPIKKDTASYIISFRRFLYDLLTRPISSIALDGVSIGYNFYDFNAKVNYKINRKNQIYGSFYMGDDKVLSKIKDKSDSEKNVSKYVQKWGNLVGALRWNHLYNQKLFSNVTLAYTRYRFLTDISNNYTDDNETEEYYNSFISGIQDVSAKLDFDYNVSANYRIKFGATGVFHIFEPGTSSYSISSDNSIQADTSFGNYHLNAWEGALYIENEFEIGQRLSFNVGLRASLYKVEDENFYSLEPRVTANYIFGKSISLKASYAKMQQYVHLLSNSGAGMSIDLWMPATDKIPPSVSNQWALGIAKSIKNGVFELSVEAYYKEMNNLIAYKEGANYLVASNNWEDKVETNGLGKSYGIEFLFRKKRGHLTGWVGYTLSKTTRQFENINFGEPYPYRYDRRHDVSIVLMYQLKENIDISATWVFGTGNAFTMAVGKYYIIDDPYGKPENYYYPWDMDFFDYNTEIHIYDGKNNYRMRNYHRLDIGMNFHKEKKRGIRTWNVSIYNVYNRQNPYFYYFETSESTDWQGNTTRKTVVKQQSLFPIIPSVSYSFRF
jgi:hypothetical protein